MVSACLISVCVLFLAWPPETPPGNRVSRFSPRDTRCAWVEKKIARLRIVAKIIVAFRSAKAARLSRSERRLYDTY